MVTFSMTFTDTLPGIQGHGIFEVEYHKNGASYGQSYYRTLYRKQYLTIWNGTMFGDLD